MQRSLRPVFAPARGQFNTACNSTIHYAVHMVKPFRTPLFDFPDLLLHADELRVKKHPRYAAAKAGDADAAELLVNDLASQNWLPALRVSLQGFHVELLPVHALESEGVNEIPAALAEWLSAELNLPVMDTVVQSNTVGHTGASGFERLAHQAVFAGEVERGRKYLLVDDFIGQGGTLANLIGYVHRAGGQAIAATVLTGKPYSAKLAPDSGQIQALRDKHGRDLEKWWREHVGFGFDCLTRSEARYLEKSPDAQVIRDRLIASGLEGSPDASQSDAASIKPDPDPESSGG